MNFIHIFKKKFSMSAEEFLLSAEEEGLDTSEHRCGTDFKDMSKDDFYNFFVKIIIPYIITTSDSSEDAIYKIKELSEEVLR